MRNGFFFNTPIDNIFIGHQMAEIYKDHSYLKYFQGKKDLTVLDVGANIGMTSYYFSQFAKTVYAFEPTSEHFETLTYMIDYNKIENVKPFKIALSNEDGEAIFYLMPNKTMNSLRPAEVVQNHPSEKVKTIRLDTFFKQEGIEHVDFMKLDVEGSEADILCGDGFQSVGDKIDILFMELHNWMGRNPNQIREALNNVGLSDIDQVAGDAQLLVARRKV